MSSVEYDISNNVYIISIHTLAYILDNCNVIIICHHHGQIKLINYQTNVTKESETSSKLKTISSQIIIVHNLLPTLSAGVACCIVYPHTPLPYQTKLSVPNNTLESITAVARRVSQPPNRRVAPRQGKATSPSAIGNPQAKFHHRLQWAGKGK